MLYRFIDLQRNEGKEQKMARILKHGNNRTWELALKAIHQLGDSASKSDILGLIVKSEAGYNERNLHADLNAMSVNSPSRGGSGKNKKPRRTDSDNKYDALFKHGKGQNAVYEIYDPRKHGVWEIYADSSATTGLSTRRVESEYPELTKAQSQANEEEPFNSSSKKDAHERSLNDTHQDIPRLEDQHIFPDEIQDADTYYEGAKQTVIVNSYERNPKARSQCIEHYGAICRVCDFNFEKKYGAIGSGFTHVHHLTPLPDIGEEYEVDPIIDLRPVCPNCHAMLHKKQPPYSIEELKSICKKQHN